MATQLHQRLSRLKVPVMLKMRHYKGPCELVNWWEHFIGKIPKAAEFEDLDEPTRKMILEWEREIIQSLPDNTEIDELDLETQAMVFEWEKGNPKGKRK